MDQSPASGAAEVELSYHPVFRDAATLLTAGSVMQVLVVGDDVPEQVAAAGEIRQHLAPNHQLPCGTYRFAIEAGFAVLVVTEGPTPGHNVTATWDAPDADPLIQAWGWFSQWWPDATAVPHPLFAINAEVVTVPGGEETTIRSRLFARGEWRYTVRLHGSTVERRESTLARPDLNDDSSRWIQGPPANARALAATLTRAKLSKELSDTLYSFRATRTVFRPYQFRPVIRLLETGTLRLLIADEVGLGKTIEAGLVWTELDARGQADRVLIVCPSMLVAKWRAEMEERFDYNLAELDVAGLNDMMQRLENDRLPQRFHAITSVERLRIWKNLEAFSELAPKFDLIVADEAHVFRNSSTRSFALGSLLDEWADALVFLSATPLNLGNEDLYNLLSLLAPGEFVDKHSLELQLQPNAVLHRISTTFFDTDSTNAQRRELLERISGLAFETAVTTRSEFGALRNLFDQPDLSPADIAQARRLIARLHALSAVVSRTRKTEIQDNRVVRRAEPIEVEWTADEADFYFAFARWQRDRALDRGLPVGFVTQMPLRLASTCLPAARARVLNWNNSSDVAEDDVDNDHDDDDMPPPLELIGLARTLGDVDSKFDAFVEHLDRLVGDGHQILVFTFSRVALRYLQTRLSDRYRVDVMHGGIDKTQRRRTMLRFREGQFDVLLASRVASEGLDFEFCSVVVNYDLPWNPMEVEQRIGRIDRFGQKSDTVLILNFHTPGTIETDIISRVHQRIGVFESSIGELEPILQSHLSELRQVMFDFRLTEEEREIRLNRNLVAIDEQRRTKEEIETATSFLSSTDNATIDGLEERILATGRYVGQRELLLLIEDWAQGARSASCQLSSDGLRMYLRADSTMLEQLKGVQTAGQRSASEIERYARAMRDDTEITICLDQEVARLTGEPLLTANNPLVRAALRVPGAQQAKYAHIQVESETVEPGSYFVLFGIMEWKALRPFVELISSAVRLDSGLVAPGVGDVVLAALADGRLSPYDAGPMDLSQALRACTRELRRQRDEEEDRRRQENLAVIEARRVSLVETHNRKVAQIRHRIETSRARGKAAGVRLNTAQLKAQEPRLRDALANLDSATVGTMDFAEIATCVVHVTAPAIEEESQRS